MTAPTLSLYKIDLELLELMHAREEVAASTEMTPQEIADTLATIDNHVTEYLVKAIENKTDAVAYYVRECEERARLDREEAKRLKEQADAWDTQRTYIERTVMQLMQRAGSKRVEGRHHKLMLYKNPASVEVAQPELVPEPYLRFAVTVTKDLWARLLAHLMPTEKGAPLFAELMECKCSTAEPMLSKIKEELKADIGVPGCRLVDDKVRLEIK